MAATTVDTCRLLATRSRRMVSGSTSTSIAFESRPALGPLSSPDYLCERGLEERHLFAGADGDADVGGQRRPGAADGDLVLEHGRIDLPARPLAVDHDH